MSVTEYPAVRFDRMTRKQAITTCLALEDMRDRAVAEVERLRAERAETLAEVARLRQALFEVLASFTHKTHPGRDCRQSDHVAVEVVDKWRAALKPTP